MSELFPDIAISVRQPWAWAILHAGKDIENRPLFAPWRPLIGKRVAIHASKGMTQAEYDDAAEFMGLLCGPRARCPNPADLVRGGVIGSVRVVEVVDRSASPWFFGPCGIVLADPVPLPVPFGCIGALGVFDWRKRRPVDLETPKPWMVRR